RGKVARHRLRKVRSTTEGAKQAQKAAAGFSPHSLRNRSIPVKSMDDRLGLPAGAFSKLDAEEGEIFYEPPRLDFHIHDGAITGRTDFYGKVLPAGGVLLDVMSSWVSHLPPEAQYAEVIGHGMNAEELAANPRLNRWFVQNLNRDWRLPLSDASVDAAM